MALNFLGGYGYVSKVFDINDPQKKYAVKKINVMDEANEAAVAWEISNWGSLENHPNICKFIGHSVIRNQNDSETHLILMDLCTEGTLVDYLQQHECKLDEEQILNVMIQICKGVKHMHDHRPPIAHRDLKVENILHEN